MTIDLRGMYRVVIVNHMTTTNKVVECRGETWQDALDERAAFIASVRAAGGMARIAKNAAGEHGKRYYVMGRDLYATNETSCFVAWVRVSQ